SLAPLYDVISADPHVHPGTLPAQKVQLAMAIGDNRHYRVREIYPSHFLQTAARCHFGGMDALLEEVRAQIPRALAQVQRELPSGFPTEVSEPIFRAVVRRAGRFGASP